MLVQSIAILLAAATTGTLAGPVNTTLLETRTDRLMPGKGEWGWIGAYGNKECSGGFFEGDACKEAKTCRPTFSDDHGAHFPTKGVTFLGVNWGSGAKMDKELYFYSDDKCTKAIGHVKRPEGKFEGGGVHTCLGIAAELDFACVSPYYSDKKDEPDWLHTPFKIIKDHV